MKGVHDLLDDKAHAYVARREYNDRGAATSRVFRQYRWALRWAQALGTSWSVTPLYPYNSEKIGERGQ